VHFLIQVNKDITEIIETIAKDTHSSTTMGFELQRFGLLEPFPCQHHPTQRQRQQRNQLTQRLWVIEMIGMCSPKSAHPNTVMKFSIGFI
jgi:hypothetical protein